MLVTMSMISFCSPVRTGRTDGFTKTGLKHTNYYLFSENNASTSFLALLDGSKFFEINFRCVEVEVKKDF